ncbi:unnamed protein product, partial [Cylicostephanus goldi]
MAKDGREEHVGDSSGKTKTRDEMYARGKKVQKEMRNGSKVQEYENKSLRIANGWSTTGKSQQEQTFVARVAYNERQKDSELHDIYTDGKSRKQELTQHSVGHHNAKHFKDSQLLQGDGSFTGKTMNQIEYVAVKGERYEMKRPKDSEIFDSNVPFTGKTLNQQEYITVKGERYKNKRPKDSGILNSDGSFRDKTLNQQEFVTVKGER